MIRKQAELAKQIQKGAIVAVAIVWSGATSAGAAVTTGPAYIYSTLLLGDLTQSCVQAGPGGTFVGRGPGFTGNGQSVVLVSESGAESLVASGFNSIGDCAYDPVIDTLYVTDNSLEAPGAVTGDTVFAIAAASSAPGVTAAGTEVVIAGSLSFASGVALDAAGAVFVTSSAGGGAGRLDEVAPGVITPLVAGLDFAAGVAFDANGDVLVAESLDDFTTRVTRWSPAGALLDVVAGPGFDFGSIDADLDVDGRLLVTGAFGGPVVSMNVTDGSTLTLVDGLTFATGVDVDPFTGRVNLLSSTFVPTDEDLSVHRLIRKDRLVPGKGSAKTECVGEIYGVELVPAKPGKPAKKAICIDGAACDGDGAVNDECVFPIGSCFNVADAAFPDCSSSEVSVFAVKKQKPADPSIDAFAAAVQAAIPLIGEQCLFSDGFRVPVKITNKGTKKDGKGTLKLQAIGLGAKALKDTDAVKMICRPAP